MRRDQFATASCQSRSPGIYSDPACTADRIDHAALIVGYGVDDQTNQAYWIVKIAGHQLGRARL
ncbi:hypothetical protein ISP15_17420 [Dyella jejuensis]|uniref:Peptidase C1A papain C-terminal domain-containing protein n=1 Tax=Dyella jejuensis TaxID=1432009 RepID=A0ABW8JQS9_9GAMM